jgi:hypothetical protein
MGTAQAQYRSLPGHRGQVYGSSAKTAFPNVTHFPDTDAKQLVSTDFFVVPTDTFRVLYVFVALAHERRPPPSFQRYLPPQLGMDSTTDGRGASLG